MKLSFLVTCASAITGVVAWKVDSRCGKDSTCGRRLEEAQILVGDEAEDFFDHMEDEVYEPVEFDDEPFELVELHDELFDWDDLSIYYREDQSLPEELLTFEDLEGIATLRGSNQLVARNRTSDVSRQLQSGREFNLKLYWQTGHCWQCEWIERKWCMECRGKCRSGDRLDIQKCARKDTQRFQWSNGRIKAAGTDLCLTKSGGLRLRSCSGSNNQKFNGYKSNGGFQISPSGSGSQCLSQHHHPKAGEIIELTNCNLAKSHNTDKWNVYWPSSGGGDEDDDDEPEDRDGNDNDNDNENDGGGGNALKKRGVDACTENNPCEKCEGDCDNDNQCAGSLKCFQRYGSSRYAEVPGCSGTGFKGLDFCY